MKDSLVHSHNGSSVSVSLMTSVCSVYLFCLYVAKSHGCLLNKWNSGTHFQLRVRTSLVWLRLSLTFTSVLSIVYYRQTCSLRKQTVVKPTTLKVKSRTCQRDMFRRRYKRISFAQRQGSTSFDGLSKIGNVGTTTFSLLGGDSIFHVGLYSKQELRDGDEEQRTGGVKSHSPLVYEVSGVSFVYLQKKDTVPDIVMGHEVEDY